MNNALCENHDVSVMDWKGIREASGAAIISRVEGGRGEAKGTSGSEKHAGAKNVCGGLENVMRSEMGRDVPCRGRTERSQCRGKNKKTEPCGLFHKVRGGK